MAHLQSRLTSITQTKRFDEGIKTICFGEASKHDDGERKKKRKGRFKVMKNHSNQRKNQMLARTLRLSSFYLSSNTQKESSQVQGENPKGGVSFIFN